jgi:hypothetical protein
MSDSAPRGFARFSPDIINLLAWVMLLGALGSALSELIWIATNPLIAATVQREFSRQPLAHLPLLLLLGVNGSWPRLARGILVIVAGVGLLRRRPWSINLLLVAWALGLLLILGFAALEIWGDFSAVSSMPPFPGHFSRGLRTVLSTGGSVAVNILVLRWLYRFRREFSPAPEPAAPASVESSGH